MHLLINTIIIFFAFVFVLAGAQVHDTDDINPGHPPPYEANDLQSPYYPNKGQRDDIRDRSEGNRRVSDNFLHPGHPPLYHRREGPPPARLLEIWKRIHL